MVEVNRNQEKKYAEKETYRGRRMRVKAMYEYEHNCRDNGHTVVAELIGAGGPLAGPVYAAAVILSGMTL